MSIKKSAYPTKKTAGSAQATFPKELNNYNSTDQQEYVIGVVEKMQVLARAAAMSELSRAELAVLVVIADHINAKNGSCYMGFSHLSESAATSARHAKEVVKKLADRQLITVESGNRQRANTYRLCPDRFPLTPKEMRNLPPAPSEPQITTLVNPSVLNSDAQSTALVIPISPQSVFESEHKAKDEKDSVEEAAAPLRPRGAGGLPHNNGDLFPEFWQAFSIRSAVADAEAELRQILERGIDYNDVLDGAKRYAIYNHETNGWGKATNAAKWLKAEKWRDDWTPPKERVKASPKTEKEEAPVRSNAKPKKEAKPTRTRAKPKGITATKEYEKWEARKDYLHQQRVNASMPLDNHTQHCNQCSRELSHSDVGYCETGLALSKQAEPTYRAYYQHLAQEPKEKYEP